MFKHIAFIGVLLIVGLEINARVSMADSFDDAKRQIENKDWDAALNSLNKTINENQKQPLPYYFRAIVFNEKGQLFRAINDLNQAISLDRNDARYYIFRTQLQDIIDKENRLKQQILDQEKLEKEKLEKENALTQASLLWSNGELKKAQAVFNNGIEYNPKLLKFPLYHLKKPTFLNIGDTRRLVTDQEVFLVNDSTGKILYPYPDVAVDPTNLTEGKRIEVAGECLQKGTLCRLKLRVVADLDLDHALLWDDKLPPQSTQIQVQPSLSKVYTFTAEIPLEIASKPFELVLVSRKGRSFKYELQLQGTQLQVKQTAKELANEL